MAENLIDLRRRIKSVKNTQKSTKAMKTVSAAKLRRSVGELNKTKPMMAKIAQLLNRVGNVSDIGAHPLLDKREEGAVILVVMAADKGLCGAFNSHILEKAEARFKQLVKTEGDDMVTLVTLGNKAFKYFSKRDYPVQKDYKSVMSRLTYNNALDLSTYLRETYLDTKVPIKSIEFIYTQYLSAGRQEITGKQLFPIQSDWESEETGSVDENEYIFEPSAEELFKALLPKYINSLVYQVLLQSSASEHAARMIAMELATNNASDMIRSLTLTMNKIRQASITNEILEIITATEALQK